MELGDQPLTAALDTQFVRYKELSPSRPEILIQWVRAPQLRFLSAFLVMILMQMVQKLHLENACQRAQIATRGKKSICYFKSTFRYNLHQRKRSDLKEYLLTNVGTCVIIANQDME